MHVWLFIWRIHNWLRHWAWIIIIWLLEWFLWFFLLLSLNYKQQSVYHFSCTVQLLVHKLILKLYLLHLFFLILGLKIFLLLIKDFQQLLLVKIHITFDNWYLAFLFLFRHLIFNLILNIWRMCTCDWNYCVIFFLPLFKMCESKRVLTSLNFGSKLVT